MYTPLLPLLLIVLAGVAWRRWRIGGLDHLALRRSLNVLVLYLLAPALILNILLHATLDRRLLIVPAAGFVTVALTLLVTLGCFGYAGRALGMARPRVGALILAATFGNGLGMALPAVQGLLGDTLAVVPTIYDVLLTIPVTWTVGVLIAAHFGGAARSLSLGKELLRLPPVWVLALALLLRATDMALPAWLTQTVRMLAAAAVPTLVLLVGLTLNLSRVRDMVVALPAVVIKIVVAPALMWLIMAPLGVGADYQGALLITAAAPSVAVGIAFADRFALDAELFCTVLTLSTGGYLLVAPIYLGWLG